VRRARTAVKDGTTLRARPHQLGFGGFLKLPANWMFWSGMRRNTRPCWKKVN